MSFAFLSNLSVNTNRSTAPSKEAHLRGLTSRAGLMALPAFHTLGVIAQLLIPLYSATTAALYPPVAATSKALPIMPTPQNIIDHLKWTKSTWVFVVPAILLAWSQDNQILSFLSTLEFVVSTSNTVPARKTTNLILDEGLFWRRFAIQNRPTFDRCGHQDYTNLRYNRMRGDIQPS